MKKSFGIPKKIILTGAAVLMLGVLNAQTVEMGVNDVDSYKFAKAKEVYTALVQKDPSDANYFYLGNTYLEQAEPDFAKASEYFSQGLATSSNKKNVIMSRIGEASVKLGKGNKAAAIAEFTQIAKDAKRRDRAEVNYRIGEALTLYPNSNNPQMAIDYLQEAISEVGNNVPGYYYYILGDAYRLDKRWGDAMNAYESAISNGKGDNKAGAYTRMGTLWTSAKRYDLAKENIDKAIAAGPSYAPAYKARGNYYIIYQEWDKAAADYKKYLDLADSDPNTVLDYAKLAFIAQDYQNASNSLNSVWDKITDPIKYRIKAYLDYNNGNYQDADASLKQFLSQVEKSRILPSDSGLEGLIMAGLAKDNSNNQSIMAQAKQKVQVAVDADDQTFNWMQEYAKVSGVGPQLPDASEGPSNAQIEQMRRDLVSSPEDTDLLFKLAQEYQNVENWGGAAEAWSKMTNLLPDWAPGFYGLGYSCQKGGDSVCAMDAYKQYVAKVEKSDNVNKETLSATYYNMANLSRVDEDYNEALKYANRAEELNPSDGATKELIDVLHQLIAQANQQEQQQSDSLDVDNDNEIQEEN